MKIEELVDYLKAQGHRASLGKYNLIPCIDIALQIEGLAVELLHFPENKYSELPTFLLKNPESYGQLAHINFNKNLGIGTICVNDQDSVSVNYEQPFLAVQESLKRHIKILHKGLTDPVWNKSELLREFYSNWINICNSNSKNLVCASADGRLEEMQVLSPVSGKNYGFGSLFLGITASASELSDFSYIHREKKKSKRVVIGSAVVVPLNNLSPAPSTQEELDDWYLNAINSLPVADNKAFIEKHTLKRSKEFWIVFNGETPSGRTWFGLHIQCKKKRTLPIKKSSLGQCKITPISVRTFNKERLMPRSGASILLSDKSVLLVGCGSVGGEITYKLGAAGVGELSLCDPETYSLENIYRHVLVENYFGLLKSRALSYELEIKYPWIKVKGYPDKLLDLKDTKIFEGLDLIVIAIGSPTHERLFHDFLVENKINIPVINTWVEGYGVGGHATLDIPGSKGCLRCAYVDQDNLTRGLASNLNFFEVNQDLTVNHAGCGELFLPYSAISAAQTALIASDIAVRYLDGRIVESSKISWKGDDTDAVNKGFILTHRYKMFNESLKVLPLYNEYCDICNG